MAVSLTRFSWWIWGNKEKEKVTNSSSSSSLNSSTEWGFTKKEQHESVKFPLVKGKKIAATSSHKNRKFKRKWESREQRRVVMDREYDVVLVPSDGGACLSESESDDSDWSIGWLEPHGLEFQNDDESDNSFAVLVPCYRHGCKEVVDSSKNDLLGAFKNIPDEFSSGKIHINLASCL